MGIISKIKSSPKVYIKILALVLCVYFFLNILFFDTYSLLSFTTQKKELNKLVEANEKIVKQNQELEEEIDKLKNDSFYIESIARRYYSMVKKGETVYIFRDGR